MVAYDFPANPIVGQSFPTGDKTYIWNGYAWGLDPVAGVTPPASYVLKTGDTMTGHLTLNADPVQPLHAATKQYIDVKIPPAGLDGQALVSLTSAAVWGAPIDAGNF